MARTTKSKPGRRPITSKKYGDTMTISHLKSAYALAYQHITDPNDGPVDLFVMIARSVELAHEWGAGHFRRWDGTYYAFRKYDGTYPPGEGPSNPKEFTPEVIANALHDAMIANPDGISSGDYSDCGGDGRDGGEEGTHGYGDEGLCELDG